MDAAEEGGGEIPCDARGGVGVVVVGRDAQGGDAAEGGAGGADMVVFGDVRGEEELPDDVDLVVLAVGGEGGWADEVSGEQRDVDGGVDVFGLHPVEAVDEDSAGGEGEDGEFHGRDGELAAEARHDLGDAPEDFDDGKGFEEEVAFRPVIELVFVDSREAVEQFAVLPHAEDFECREVVEAGALSGGRTLDHGRESTHVCVLYFGYSP